MVTPQSRSAESVPCDFCSDQVAILYCRADSAKLCLFCDQHVHSANLLSRKHLRSQICDNCASEPVSVRCATDNLVLCQECDWDAHGTCSLSASHDRNPVDAFSGCPSALELASIWGFDLVDKKPARPDPIIPHWACPHDMLMPADSSSWTYYKYKPDGVSLQVQDLIVPNENGVVFPNMGCGEVVMKKQSCTARCGRQKQVMHKQLVELLRRDLMASAVGGGDGDGDGDGDGGGESNYQPGTPNRSGGCWQGNVEAIGLRNENNGDDVVHGVSTGSSGGAGVQQHLQQQTTPFTSLLMMPVHPHELKDGDGIVDGDMLWDTNPNGQSTQIWDFNLGRLREHEESGALEVAYCSNDGGFTIKNFGELMKETSLTSSKILGDIYQINCPVGQDDMTFNNNGNNPTASQGPATSESNNLPLGRPSSGSGLGKETGCSASKDVRFTEQSFLVRSDSLRTAAATKANIEMLAQNRGNAMQRYKEKKKTRRELGRARLAGPLVPELGNLTFLEYFVVFGNNINGTIPSEIGHLKKLIRLELQQNILTGPIPDSFGNLTALKFLDLSNNNLTGSIPVSLGQLATLQTLNLNSNNLTGTIPTEVLGLVRLAVIRLINVSNNKLDGSVHNSTSGLVVTSIVQDPKA